MTEETKQPISLKSLLTPSKTVEFDYPGFEGFKVKLTYLAREELMKLRNRCVSQKFNKKTKRETPHTHKQTPRKKFVDSILSNIILEKQPVKIFYGNY